MGRIPKSLRVWGPGQEARAKLIIAEEAKDYWQTVAAVRGMENAALKRGKAKAESAGLATAKAKKSNWQRAALFLQKQNRLLTEELRKQKARPIGGGEMAQRAADDMYLKLLGANKDRDTWNREAVKQSQKFRATRTRALDLCRALQVINMEAPIVDQYGEDFFEPGQSEQLSAAMEMVETFLADHDRYQGMRKFGDNFVDGGAGFKDEDIEGMTKQAV